MKLFYSILFVFLFIAGSKAQFSDTLFTKQYVDFYCSEFRHIRPDIIYNNEREVEISPANCTYFGFGMSFKFDDNYIFSLSGGYGLFAYNVKFHYEDVYQEVGYDVYGEHKIRNPIVYFNMNAAQNVRRADKKAILIGGGITLSFQGTAIEGAQWSTYEPQHNSVMVFRVDSHHPLLLPAVSPRIFSEFEIIRSKDLRNSLYVFATYNYSGAVLVDGKFRIYKGNMNYSTGKFLFYNHFLSAGIHLRFQDI